MVGGRIFSMGWQQWIFSDGDQKQFLGWGKQW